MNGLFAGALRDDSIQSQEHEVFRIEGDSVTLSCTYSTHENYIFLNWYRHCPEQAPQFILYRGARSRSSATHTSDFSSQSDHSTSVLNISALGRADTGVCVLLLEPGAVR